MNETVGANDNGEDLALMYEYLEAVDAERQQLFEQVREALWSLSRPHREILVLHYLEQYEQSELTELLGLSDGAVRKRLHDARCRVRDIYATWLADNATSRRPPTSAPPWRQKMITTDSSNRTPQEKIDAMHRPRWCVATEAGRLYWDLVCAAMRNDVETIQQHLKDDEHCARLEYWYTPPIHFAVREGHAEATRVLWEAYPCDEVTRLITMAQDRGHTGVSDVLREAIGSAAASCDLRLHEAVEARDIDEIAHLLRKVPRIGEQCDPQGRTAVHMAVIGGGRAAVDALIRDGAPLDVTDHLGFRPIHYACWRSPYWQPVDAGLVARLLEAGAADSPTLVAYRGDLDALKGLVKVDAAAANDADTLGKRPLSSAVQAGHKDVVRYLLDQGADPKLPEGRQCPHGLSLMEASVSDQIEVAGWLLEAGADPNGYIDSSATPTIRAGSDAMRGLLYGYGGQAENAWGLAQRGQLGALAAILRYCDDPFTNEDEEFLTTPYTAIVSGWQRRADKGESTDAHEAMLAMFLQRQHPMPKVLTACKSYLYHTPHMTRQLLEHGLDPNLPDWLRRTPLHDICAGHRQATALPVLEMFLEHGADINAVDEQDRSTPLGIAAREGDTKLVELLLFRGADPQAAGDGWARPLAWARRRGHSRIAETLRKSGAV